MENEKIRKLKEELPGVKKNVPLKDHTTFKIGGPALYFYEATNKEELIKAIRVIGQLPFFTKHHFSERNGAWFILGKGSNLLVHDRGFKGMIIKCSIKDIERKNSGIKAGAGLELNKLINFALKNELTGLEWAAGIPGTVGGAVRGNAGAFGKEMKDSVEEVEILNTKNLELEEFNNKGCEFSYRNSVFKKNPDLIILSTLLRLKKGKKEKILKEVKKHKNYREEHHPLEYPSSGSVFQNPSYERKVNQKLREKVPKIENFKECNIIPAGFLVEKAGLKGEKIGNAKISEKHANFIINLGGAKAKEVKELIGLVKEKVKEKFGIELKEEIQYLGF